MEYDALINTTPIDLLVEQTKICPPLNLAHNKVKEIWKKMFKKSITIHLCWELICFHNLWIFQINHSEFPIRFLNFGRYSYNSHSGRNRWSRHARPDDSIPGAIYLAVLSWQKRSLLPGDDFESIRRSHPGFIKVLEHHVRMCIADWWSGENFSWVHHIFCSIIWT